MKNERCENMKTVPLYETHSYLKEFAATVISCTKETVEINGKAMVLFGIGLDATAFFPEGGGQMADKGTLGTLKVYDVQKKGDEILHYVEEEIEVDTQVVGVIDFETRFKRMQNHAGEHLICGLIHNAFGYENVGFHLTDECVTMDVDGPLSLEELESIEERANEVIAENVPIRITFPPAEELKKLDYRSKLDLDSGVRIVTIEGYDACACCAPHPSSTGEIEVIKIIDSLPHRGGTRIILRCGKDAYLDYKMLHDNNQKIMRLLSAKREECDEAVAKILDKLKEEKEKNLALEKKISDIYREMIQKRLSVGNADENREEAFFVDGISDIQIRNLINEAVIRYDGVVIIFTPAKEGYRYIAGRRDELAGTPLPILSVSMNEALSGRGGGSKKMIQGSVLADKEEIEAFFSRRQRL